MQTVIIRAETGQQVYMHVLQHVLSRGQTRSPRGRETLDGGCVIIELDELHNALPMEVGRNLNPNIAAAEAVQLIGAFSMPQLLTRAAPRMSEYMDGEVFHGAYGQRIGRQMLDIETKLQVDPQTRQAIATIWDPQLDNMPNRRDYPCTVMLQFALTNITESSPKLDMTTVMRSNDAWLGLPYDMFQFTQLQMSLANALRVRRGMYRHVALSMHLYVENAEDALRIGPPKTTEVTSAQGLGVPGEAYINIMVRAGNLARGLPNEEGDTESERWYRERFASYMGRDLDEYGARGR